MYASMLMSVSLSALARIYPMHSPLTYEPMLELVFAIFLPAVGSAILFNIGASSGGTDIIAMILKSHSSLNIGSALFLVDVASVLMAFFVIGPTTGLYSTVGLMAKSLAIDGVIENINQCKCFNIFVMIQILSVILLSMSFTEALRFIRQRAPLLTTARP